MSRARRLGYRDMIGGELFDNYSTISGQFWTVLDSSRHSKNMRWNLPDRPNLEGRIPSQFFDGWEPIRESFMLKKDGQRDIGTGTRRDMGRKVICDRRDITSLSSSWSYANIL